MGTSTTKTIAIKPLNRIKELYEKPAQEEVDHSYEITIQERIVEAEERLKELQRKQEETVTKTNEDISALKSEWEHERQQLVTQAKKEGYAAGFEHATEGVEKAYRDKLAKANELIQTAEHEHDKRIEESINSLIDLSTEIAEKIIHKQIAENEDAFLSLVQGAIEELKEQPEVNIYVPAEHYEFMMLQKSELVELMNGKANVLIYIAPNDQAYITHPLGKIDISIDTQLTQMREKLLEIAMENQL